MSEHKFIAGLVLFAFIELILFGMYAIYHAEIVCPELPTVTQANPIAWIVSSIGLFFSPCAGLPIWVYILIFTPLAIALIGYITPFIG